MRVAKRVIGIMAATGGVGALASVHLGLATPEQIGMAAAVVAGAITVFTSWVAASKSISTDRKVDNVTVLVDGRYSDVLRELADVREMLAEQSGTRNDQTRADVARHASNMQDAKVNQARIAAEGK